MSNKILGDSYCPLGDMAARGGSGQEEPASWSQVVNIGANPANVNNFIA